MAEDERVVEVRGVRLAYRVSGPPDGTPLVLLHGTGEGAADWSTVLPDLAATHRAYALDLRGHGASDRPGRYSLELMRDDVLGVLDALDLPVVDLVGHSMGGVVGYLVAQAAPDRVARLVLEDTPAPLSRVPTLPVRPDGELDFDWEMVLAVRPQLDTPDPAWLAGLGRITADTLVVAGGPDSHVSQESVAELSRRIPRAELVTIPVGHLVHAGAPAEFVRAVTAFLGPG
ncbi:MAG TPA: alpha/beta hydrolase [Actinocatenispora sp.]